MGNNEYKARQLVEEFEDYMESQPHWEMDEWVEFAKYCYNKALIDAADNVELKEYKNTPQNVDTISNDMGDVYGVDKQSILNLEIL